MFIYFTDAAVAEEGSVGEVSLQVDLFTHPGTGEHKITVKGMIIFYHISFFYSLIKSTNAWLVSTLFGVWTGVTNCKFLCE